MRRALVVVWALSVGAGCSSSYEPARSPRIETVISGGQPTFVKDGVHIGSAVWGTGLVDAVEGNPEAQHHAEVGRNLIAGGFAMSLVGLASEIGGLAVLVHDNNQPAAQNDAQASGLAVGLLVGGLAVALAGSVMMMAGQPHVYDAVNIYNDSLVLPRPAAALPVVAPPAIVPPAVAPPAVVPNSAPPAVAPVSEAPLSLGPRVR